MVGFVCIFIILVICATILVGMYLYYCSENSIGIFDRTKYKSDLKDLKDAVNELTKEIQEMKK